MIGYWTGTSQHKLEEAEKALWELSGLNEEEYKSYPVWFNFGPQDWRADDTDEGITKEPITEISWQVTGHVELVKQDTDNEYIWTYEFGEQQKPVLVILHGYGGSGMVFYKLFQQLKERFHVYLIDLMGLGRSSRHEFECQNYEEWEQYFVSSLEKWRIKVGIEKMNLLGHSFGGFISSKYALHHPEHVEKLMLFSPFLCEQTNEEHELTFDQNISNTSIFHKIGYSIFKRLYARNLTPFYFLRYLGQIISKTVVSKMALNRLAKVPEEEQAAFLAYIYQILLQSGSGEYAFKIMFPKMMFSDNAIFNHLDEYLNIDISFYFGDADWMNSSYGGVSCSDHLKQLGHKVYFVEDAGHQLFFDNPKQSAEYIITEMNA